MIGGVNNFISLKSKKTNQGKISFNQPKPVDLKLIVTQNQVPYKRFVGVEKFSKREEVKQVVVVKETINALTTFAPTPAQAENTQEKVVEELRLKKKQEVDEAVRQRDEAVQEMQRVRSSLAEATSAIQKLEFEREQLQSSIEATAKDLKSKDMIAAGLSGLDERQAQVKSMEAEVEELENEWREAEDELQQGLSKARRQFEEKKSEVEMKQEKIEFYEENYSKLVQELKSEISKRERLINEYKNMAKDMKREYLAELISSTKERCKESETATQVKLTELKSLNNAIQKLDEEIKYLTNDLNTRVGEGEDKKKKDNKSFDKIRAAFDSLSKIFVQTKQYMEKFVDLRVKNKQLQDRVMELKRNKYQEISEKLKRDLGELTK